MGDSIQQVREMERIYRQSDYAMSFEEFYAQTHGLSPDAARLAIAESNAALQDEMANASPVERFGYLDAAYEDLTHMSPTDAAVSWGAFDPALYGELCDTYVGDELLCDASQQGLEITSAETLNAKGSVSEDPYARMQRVSSGIKRGADAVQSGLFGGSVCFLGAHAAGLDHEDKILAAQACGSLIDAGTAGTRTSGVQFGNRAANNSTGRAFDASPP